MINADHDAFLAQYEVTYETIHDLETYRDLLVSWNEKFNLISASTVPLIWQRHFVDCAQLLEYVPTEAVSLADMGAGAGFPGLVLAILTKQRSTKLHVVEIEATNKKADFLQAVVDELKLNVTVRRERIEDIRDLKSDVLTARALKALPELFVYANYLTHKNTVCIFPKGQQAAEELTAARKYWTFNLETHPSRSDPSGSVLVVKDLRYKSRR